MTKVEITQVGYQSLAMLTRYMAEFIGAEKAFQTAENILDIVNQKLASNPLQFPVCYELELLGVSDYQQITLENYKVLFRYDATTNSAYVNAFMRHKQSAQQLLIDYLLLP